MQNDTEDTTIYRVVINDEEQYSIWPDYREIPLGWREVGKSGLKQDCLDYIKEVWTDMRPLSLRKKWQNRLIPNFSCLHMSENDPKLRLELLVPWDLPIEQKLSEADQIKLSLALNQLLAALEQPLPQEALKTIEQTLEILGKVEGLPVEPTSTKTALENWEVKDFDNYFEISHIQTQDTAVCLVKSILVAYQTLLILNSQYSGLDPTQIERQKQGFVSYAHLLARVFELHLEEKK